MNFKLSEASSNLRSICIQPKTWGCVQELNTEPQMQIFTKVFNKNYEKEGKTGKSRVSDKQLQVWDFLIQKKPKFLKKISNTKNLGFSLSKPPDTRCILINC